ncbi:MAG: hypothetical protein Q8Q20_01355 [bacterium]|nr:hypothetical protein [bacterium]
MSQKVADSTLHLAGLANRVCQITGHADPEVRELYRDDFHIALTVGEFMVALNEVLRCSGVIQQRIDKEEWPTDRDSVAELLIKYAALMASATGESDENNAMVYLLRCLHLRLTSPVEHQLVSFERFLIQRDIKRLLEGLEQRPSADRDGTLLSEIQDLEERYSRSGLSTVKWFPSSELQLRIWRAQLDDGDGLTNEEATGVVQKLLQRQGQSPFVTDETIHNLVRAVQDEKQRLNDLAQQLPEVLKPILATLGAGNDVTVSTNGIANTVLPELGGKEYEVSIVSTVEGGVALLCQPKQSENGLDRLSSLLSRLFGRS